MPLNFLLLKALVLGSLLLPPIMARVRRTPACSIVARVCPQGTSGRRTRDTDWHRGFPERQRARVDERR